MCNFAKLYCAMLAFCDSVSDSCVGVGVVLVVSIFPKPLGQGCQRDRAC